MTQVLAIAAGGALGSVLRYGLSHAVHALFGRGFPYGTLAVNVLGCLAMGYLSVLLLERPGPNAVARAGLLVGLLGGFTTFSAFSMETPESAARGHLAAGGALRASQRCAVSRRHVHRRAPRAACLSARLRCSTPSRNRFA